MIFLVLHLMSCLQVMEVAAIIMLGPVSTLVCALTVFVLNILPGVSLWLCTVAVEWHIMLRANIGRHGCLHVHYCHTPWTACKSRQI